MAAVAASVVVPCYNARATIGTQLAALAAQAWPEPWEVIVADNGSTDGTLDVVAAFVPRLPGLRIVVAPGRRSAAHARNAAARVARGACLLFCDADDEVAPGWLAALASALGEHDFVAARFDAEKLNPPRVQRSRRNVHREGVPHFAWAPYFPHYGAGGLGIRRRLHEAVGGFDESLRFAEDSDYCFRVQLTGAKLRFVPDAVVHVRYRDGLGAAYRQAYRWAVGSVLLHKRHRPAGMPPLTAGEAVRYWGSVARGLARAARQLGSRDTRAAAAWQLGALTGRLKGCLTHRVLAPR